MENNKSQCIEEINNLFCKYNDNPGVTDKILYYIKKELPERINLLIEREERKHKLEVNAESYINEFLINSENKYVYIPKSEFYIKYDGKDFSIENESNILHTILADISKKSELIPWKYKIKNMIIKKIKDTDFFSIIPESNTIQNILQFLTKTIFENKDLSKYFLTIIGDNILKKQQNIVHLVDNKSKHLLHELEYQICDYFKNIYHCNATFKFTWNNYLYNNCRILTLAPLVEKKGIWINFIKKNFLNLISVSVYYSKRFNSSEDFIKKIPNIKTINKINFLKNKTPSDIVSLFTNEVKIEKKENSSISLKEMHYLWKIFLNNNELPYIIFLSTVTNELKKYYGFKNNRFLNIKSNHLETINIIDTFWNTFIVKEDGHELEISEICGLYNEWVQLNDESENLNHYLDEDFFNTYIFNFCDIKVNGKNIENIKCTLWDKETETGNILKELKLKYKFSPNLYENSIDSMYHDYCNTCRNDYSYKIVSKNWFTKYINQVIPDQYIKKNRILNSYWLT